MFRTRITEEYRVELPFLNAGMAFQAGVDLVVAVCEAGGLGVMGASAMSPTFFREQLRAVRARTQRPIGVDFIPSFSTAEQITICVQERVPLVVFFWNDIPPAWMAELKQGGVKVWMQVGSLDEARAAVQAGVDGLVVQGSEAGGHNRSSAATFTLLPAVVDAVAPVPVVAAGGIADGRGVAAALALGAEGVWVGTRMLASQEAFLHALVKQRIVEAQVHDTARTLIFGPEFPDAATRALRNRVVREWEGRDNPPPYHGIPPEQLPVVGQTSLYGIPAPLVRFTSFPASPDATGDFIEEIGLLAGESTGLIHDLKPARQIVHEMMNEARKIIRGRLGHMAEA
ncbi:MAG: enoyl-[acyl-carrier-protein] reductase FabK [Roseiflexaceae bacterium]